MKVYIFFSKNTNIKRWLSKWAIYHERTTIDLYTKV